MDSFDYYFFVSDWVGLFQRPQELQDFLRRVEDSIRTSSTTLDASGAPEENGGGDVATPSFDAMTQTSPMSLSRSSSFQWAGSDCNCAGSAGGSRGAGGEGGGGGGGGGNTTVSVSTPLEEPEEFEGNRNWKNLRELTELTELTELNVDLCGRSGRGSGRKDGYFDVVVDIGIE